MLLAERWEAAMGSGVDMGAGVRVARRSKMALSLLFKAHWVRQFTASSRHSMVLRHILSFDMLTVPRSGRTN